MFYPSHGSTHRIYSRALYIYIDPHNICIVSPGLHGHTQGQPQRRIEHLYPVSSSTYAPFGLRTPESIALHVAHQTTRITFIQRSLTKPQPHYCLYRCSICSMLHPPADPEQVKHSSHPRPPVSPPSPGSPLSSTPSDTDLSRCNLRSDVVGSATADYLGRRPSVPKPSSKASCGANIAGMPPLPPTQSEDKRKALAHVGSTKKVHGVLGRDLTRPAAGGDVGEQTGMVATSKDGGVSDGSAARCDVLERRLQKAIKANIKWQRKYEVETHVSAGALQNTCVSEAKLLLPCSHHSVVDVLPVRQHRSIPCINNCGRVSTFIPTIPQTTQTTQTTQTRPIRNTWGCRT